MRISDEYLAVRAQRGDTLAANALVARYRGLARACTRGRYIQGGDRDDVMSEALQGLGKAVMDYRPGRIPFKSFARVCIERQVLTAVIAGARHKHEPLTYATTSVETDEGPVDVLDTIRGHESLDPLVRLLTKCDLEELAVALRERLTELEADCLIGWVNDGDYEVVAARVGVSMKSVDNALHRARLKLEGRTAPPTRGAGDYECPGCGGPTRRRQVGPGRPPRCVICKAAEKRERDLRSAAVAA